MTVPQEVDPAWPPVRARNAAEAGVSAETSLM
jgi:hypothetical protein